MAYTPTVWETGDVITAEKLNNMEQGIEDAFVAPAVTIADEGDVLTVNSFGEWAAASLPEDVYEMEGVINVNQQMVPQGFTLTAGDAAEIPLHKIVKMKTTISVGGEVAVVELIFLLSSHNLGGVGFGSENYYFATILYVNSKIYYLAVYYMVSDSTWGTSLIELSQAAS